VFGCDECWSSVTDTWHPTIEEAKAQAEFEYEGATATWQRPALTQIIRTHARNYDLSTYGAMPL
jgi:hypothetical protein